LLYSTLSKICWYKLRRIKSDNIIGGANRVAPTEH